MTFEDQSLEKLNNELLQLDYKGTPQNQKSISFPNTSQPQVNPAQYHYPSGKNPYNLNNVKETFKQKEQEFPNLFEISPDKTKVVLKQNPQAF